ncbi:MAG: ATPase [Bifidobacteriaceae bacterium]|nr:ATPase [Bifidobacteriaceae bacterium]
MTSEAIVSGVEEGTQVTMVGEGTRQSRTNNLAGTSDKSGAAAIEATSGFDADASAGGGAERIGALEPDRTSGPGTGRGVASGVEGIGDLVAGGGGYLGIELGSTRIKACLIGPDGAVWATGSHDWENQYRDGLWTYSLEAVWEGLRAAYGDLAREVERRYGRRPRRYRALGISAMMHGYLAFDADGELLVPFRTWRNTNTGPAAAELSELLAFNMPLRWSVAHLYQAIRDGEEHVGQVDFITTLAGYVHWRLTGRKVIGIGDASGMFPIDSAVGDWDADKLAAFDQLLASLAATALPKPSQSLRELLPEVLLAGEEAGALTASGASLLDPAGGLEPGTPLCPPEGDAGTGMVATGAIAPRTGNVSVGTSIFAMVVLDRPPARVHPELDLVTTPAGDPVAMVHCNNGASELGAWAGVFAQFAEALSSEGEGARGGGGQGEGGRSVDADRVFAALFEAALAGEPDGGGLLAYNLLSGEPVVGLAEGRPLVIRTPDSRLTLANFMRAQVYAVFAALAVGMRVLAEENVKIEAMYGHGGVFKTPGVAQRLLAAAIGAPVGVAASASEGGAWGIALLARYLEAAADGLTLAQFLQQVVFAGAPVDIAAPLARDVAGFSTFLARYESGLAVERAAIQAI